MKIPYFKKRNKYFNNLFNIIFSFFQFSISKIFIFINLKKQNRINYTFN